jgi:predicted molibdopterin-dependent oxidoreductase YjgC
MKPQYGPDPKVDVVFLFGFDPSEEAPILDIHLKRAVRRGKVKLIIAHPRKIELTRYGGPYLGYRPGAEATLLNGLARYAAELKPDEKSKVAEMVADATDEALGALCNVDPAAVQKAAEMLANSSNALIIYGPLAARGQTGVQTRNGLINLALLTGHVERLAYIGLDANSQGCRDMGVLPTVLPGHIALDDAANRQRFQTLWGAELPTWPGKSYKQMLDDASQAIKALYIMGANPASERPAWANNLDKLEFLVVQELFLTETAGLADVVLPAVSWAESNGTFTNCERRVQRAPKAFNNPHSKAAPDWMILDHLATRMGHNWPYASDKAVTSEIAHAVHNYEGFTWDALGDQGAQWDAALVPWKPAYARSEQLSLPEPTDEELALVTGAVTYDGGTMFYHGEVMPRLAFPTAVVLNPVDAERLAVREGAAVTVWNTNGQLTLAARLDPNIQPGTAWIPESLPGAPVGALLNGGDVEHVKIQNNG